MSLTTEQAEALREYIKKECIYQIQENRSHDWASGEKREANDAWDAFIKKEVKK